MIPVYLTIADTLTEVWEKSIEQVWKHGLIIRTQSQNDNSTFSKDCTMIMQVENPFAEPRIHKRIPQSYEGLETYRREVVDGLHDDWVGKGWNYSYHDRLTAYGRANYPNIEFDGVSDLYLINEGVNQLQYIVDTLVDTWYSRRAHAITWTPTKDTKDPDCPCFQRMWCRLTPGGLDPNIMYLNMNTHWRSRDAFHAAYMNMFAFTSLQRQLCRMIFEKANGKFRAVLPGRYVDISDSYHIYDKDWPKVEGFFTSLGKRTFVERTMTTKEFYDILEMPNLDTIGE